VSFVAITLCIASQRLFIVIVVYFVMTQSENFWISLVLAKSVVSWNLLLPHDLAQFNFCRFPYVTPSVPHTGLNWGGEGQSHPSKEPLPSTIAGVAPSSGGA